MYVRLTKCLKGTMYDITSYLKLRKEIVMRKPFKFTYWENCQASCCCNQKMVERRALFKRATRKLHQELDIVKLIKKLRKLSILKAVLMESRHLSLIKYARKNTINILDAEEKKPEKWRADLQVLG